MNAEKRRQKSANGIEATEQQTKLLDEATTSWASHTRLTSTSRAWGSSGNEHHQARETPNSMITSVLYTTCRYCVRKAGMLRRDY